MDEKKNLDPPQPHRPETSRTRRAAMFASLFTLLSCLFALIVMLTFRSCDRLSPDQNRSLVARMLDAKNVPQAALFDDKKVPLEAHIMSKCPDALDCLQQLVLPTMVEISDRIAFTLSYIGKPTDHDDGVECKHGESECLGNMIELCAEDAYPDPKIYLGFTYCMTRQYPKIPERHMVHECAMEHGIDFARINDCLTKGDGGYAADLLQASFVRSAEANVTKSCTIRLNDKVRCIRDGGEWTDCDGGSDPHSLIHDINEIYAKLNRA